MGTGCLLQIWVSLPNPTQDEQVSLSYASDFIGYLEHTSFPQRATLEQLLIDEQQQLSLCFAVDRER
jgi:hypothetical protein